MGQGSEVAATTDIRRVLRALRSLALLGGFAVIWCFLATGAAQADDGPGSDGGVTNRVIGTVARVAQPVGHAATKATDRAASKARAHTTAPAKTVKTLRRHTGPTVSATRSIVRNTAAAPIVTRASETLRSQVVPAVQQVRAVLEAAPVGGSVIPELEGVGDVVEDLPLVGESSPLAGETVTPRATQRSAEIVALTNTSAPTASLDAAPATVPAGQGQAAPRSGDGSEAPALHSSGGTASSSAQGGSGAGPGAGLDETGLDLTHLATRTTITSLADWQPAGPAYPPASTPD